MDPIISFLSGWAGLIGDVFADYPLAGAIVTAVAVGCYFILLKNPIPQIGPSPLRNVFVVLIGWLIAVPLLGLLFKAVGVAGMGISFLYGLFDRQPLFVVSLLAAAVAAYFIWGWLKKKDRPSPLLRIVAIGAGFFVIAGLSVPILDAFIPRNDPAVPPPQQTTTNPN